MSYPDIWWTTTGNLPRLLEIFAGGPGSGCHGPKCGRPASVKQVYTTHSGATYTIFKPSPKGRPKGQHAYKAPGGTGLPPELERNLKGKFQHARNPETNEKIRFKSKERFSNVYDAKFGRGDKYEGHGQTVFVHRDFKNMRVTVTEFPHDEYMKAATARQFRFRNFGQAAGFLNKRYGIKQALPKPGEAGRSKK